MIEGSGRMKVDDDVVELRLRVSSEAVRCLEADPEGIAFGAPRVEGQSAGADAEQIMGWWSGASATNT